MCVFVVQYVLKIFSIGVCLVLVFDGGGRVEAARDGGGPTEGWFGPGQGVCDIMKKGLFRLGQITATTTGSCCHPT